MKRSFRDRDYIETIDGLFFTVVGNVHPEDRVLAYLKYLPDRRGRWGRRIRRYVRSMKYYSASNAMKTVELLQKTYPQYVFSSQILNMTFSAVPRTKIAKYYVPEERLNELLNSKHRDLLEEKAVELALTISDESGVSVDDLGITGSILVDIHNVRFSDIDLTVYGRYHSQRVKETLLKLYRQKRILRRFEGRSLAKWCREQMSAHHLTMKESKDLYSRKWNKGMFKDTVFSIHPIRTDRNTREQYGDEIYVPRGLVQGTARIVDSKDSFFLPAIYVVDRVALDQMKGKGKVEKIVSYEALYADIATKHDLVKVRGTLEDVFDNSAHLRYRRVVVGSQKGGKLDFIKLVT